MADIKIILISSVRPEPTSGGQIVLYRHLVGQTGIELEIYGNEPDKLKLSSVIRRFFGRLGQTRFCSLSEDFWALWKGRWLDSSLPRDVTSDGRTVVLTVAHGDVCMAAMRFARKHKLPLITFFHDWWPDIPNLHSPFRKFLENDFHNLYRSSTAALCVSAGMKRALGNHPGAIVLYPIPAKANGALPTRDHSARMLFKILYFGNLCEYGPMLGRAMEALNGNQTIQLEVRGANPNWSPGFKETMRIKGLWKDFVPRHELDQWLSEADAFFIPMMFDGVFRRRMETSFPSKLVEFAQWGKPLIIWGPEYCSAVKWARQGNRALCVTDPNPAALRVALENLAVSGEVAQQLTVAARQAAKTDFNADQIQAQFVEILHQVVGSQRI